MVIPTKSRKRDGIKNRIIPQMAIQKEKILIDTAAWLFKLETPYVYVIFLSLY
jgi:hypothetical protein